jgi:hypothetical protein
VALAPRIVKEDKSFSYDLFWMTPVRHPHDDGLWLGDIATLRTLPPDVDALVSLCRVHDDDLPWGVEQMDVDATSCRSNCSTATRSWVRGRWARTEALLQIACTLSNRRRH